MNTRQQIFKKGKDICDISKEIEVYAPRYALQNGNTNKVKMNLKVN
jgi:hypothetical protein